MEVNMNLSEVFIEIMASTITKYKSEIDKYHYLYFNDANFNMLVLSQFTDQPSIEKQLEAYYSLQGKYFGYAQGLLLNEDYEYVTKCLEIIDKLTSLLSEALLIFQTKKQRNEMIIAIEAGIVELKRQLANGELMED